MSKSHLWNNFNSAHFWVSVELLDENRVDAWFYQPQFIENISLIRNWSERTKSKLKRLFQIASVDYGFMPTEDYWDSESGAPFLRVTNFTDSVFTNLSDLKYVNPSAFGSSSNILDENDTLIVQCGNTTGRIAFATSDVKGFIFPSFCLRVRAKNDKCNPYYLCSLLKSPYLQTQIQQTISVTSVRPNTTKPSIENLLIPMPDEKIQYFIGTYLRIAAYAWKQALKYWKEAASETSFLLGREISNSSFIPKDNISLSDGNYKSISLNPAISLVDSNIIDSRIGAQFYHPHVENALSIVRNSNLPTKKLVDVAKRINDRISADTLLEKGYRYIGLANIDPVTGVLSENLDDSITGTCSLFKAGDILYSKLRPYLNKVTICPHEYPFAAGSTELITYRPKNKIDSYFLYFILKSPLTLNQIIKLTSGSTHPRVDPEIVDNILIPIPDESDQIKIGLLCKKALFLQEKAKKLSAEGLVVLDHLIGGKLDTDAILSGKLKAPTWEDIEKELEEL